MPPALAYAPAAEVDLLAAFVEHTARLGLHGINQHKAARAFLRRWPDPQAVGRRAARRPGWRCRSVTRSFVMFLLLGGHLRPGYDYLMRRKLPSFWRELPHGPMAADLAQFLERRRRAGLHRTDPHRGRLAGRRPAADPDRTADWTQLTDSRSGRACWPPARQRQAADGIGLRHYSRAVHTTRQVLFHLGVLDAPPVNADDAAAAELHRADARCDPGAAADVRGLPGPADRHP